MDRKERRISELELFRACRTKDICWVASAADTVDLRAGSLLAKQGQPAREFVVVLEGEVSCGGRVVGAGGYFGHDAILDHQPHDMDIEAVGPVRLLVFEVRVFNAMLDKIPNVARMLMRGLVTELREVDSRVASSPGLRAAW
jgi:CRP-like cAMP-binding protein